MDLFETEGEYVKYVKKSVAKKTWNVQFYKMH